MSKHKENRWRASGTLPPIVGLIILFIEWVVFMEDWKSVYLFLLDVCMAGELIVLYLCMRFIIESYRESKEHRRQNNYPPSKTDKLLGLAFHLFGRLGLFFGNQN